MRACRRVPPHRLWWWYHPECSAVADRDRDQLDKVAANADADASMYGGGERASADAWDAATYATVRDTEQDHVAVQHHVVYYR